MYTIYKITNILNGKIYIGQTKGQIQDRFKQHIKDAERGSRLHLHRAINYYGKTAFKIEAIDSCSTKEEADLLETKYIANYHSLNKTVGYNMAVGGEGGNTYFGKSEKEMQIIKAKISKANQGENNGKHRVIFMKDLQTDEQIRFGSYADCERYFEARGVILKRRIPLDSCASNKKYGIQKVFLDRYIFRDEEDDFKLFSYYSRTSGEFPYKAINEVTGEEFIGLTRKECLAHIGLDPNKRNQGTKFGN